ncbi:MAG: hypothetical protein Q4G16_05260, partial [Cruoricaptor ignavus]|nr:hypothetical protein [Cruoricaptor ignavus]
MIFFKFPNSDTIYSTDGNPEVKNLSFISFNEKEVLDFCGNFIEVKPSEIPEFSNLDLSISKEENEAESQKSYTEKTEKVRDFVKHHQLKKLVISRKKILNLETDNQTVALDSTFLNLCKNYPNAFVYIFQ